MRLMLADAPPQQRLSGAKSAGIARSRTSWSRSTRRREVPAMSTTGSARRSTSADAPAEALAARRGFIVVAEQIAARTGVPRFRKQPGRRLRTWPRLDDRKDYAAGIDPSARPTRAGPPPQDRGNSQLADLASPAPGRTLAGAPATTAPLSPSSTTLALADGRVRRIPSSSAARLAATAPRARRGDDPQAAWSGPAPSNGAGGTRRSQGPARWNRRSPTCTAAARVHTALAGGVADEAACRWYGRAVEQLVALQKDQPTSAADVEALRQEQARCPASQGPPPAVRRAGPG